MYLIHLPILLSVYYAIGGVVPVYVVLMLALPLIFVASDLLNRHVEIPAMKLGKRLTLG